MSHAGSESDDLEQLRSELTLPEEFPPVEPPSAGMIIQLFLVPAAIVAVIVGVYVLFGSIASQELNWRQLVIDVGSENPHVRWRGALGLAQMLDADAARGSESKNLAANPEIATAMSSLYAGLIQVANPNEEELKQIEFLSKAMGRLSTADIMLPVFQNGIQPERDAEIRKHSLIGLAMHIGTLRDAGTLNVPSSLFEDLVETSRDESPIFRHQAAYIFGLIGTPEANKRLAVLLEDPDQMTRINSAIGFARNGALEGLPTFHEIFVEGVDWNLNPSAVQTREQEEEYFERVLMLLNSIKAVNQLAPRISPQDRSQFAGELKKLADSTRDNVLRSDAVSAAGVLVAQ